MTTQPLLSVVVAASSGSRALLLTAESAMRQTAGPLELRLATPASSELGPLVPAAAARLRATVVSGPDGASAINAAVAGASATAVVLLPAGFQATPDLAALLIAAFDADDDVVAVMPSVVVQSADGVYCRTWQAEAVTFVDLVADPRRAMPVFAVRRAGWEGSGGLDAALGSLAPFDLLLRLALRGRVIGLAAPLIVADAAEARSAATAADVHVGTMRAVLEKHRQEIEQRTAEVIVERELAFGRILRRHQRLVAARDRDVAELERMRATLAERRAWLVHHGHGSLEWGDFRRTDPVSREWGYDRGTPIDRYYIDAFLAAHSSDVHGRVLEVQEDDLTRRFGGPRLVQADVLDVTDANPRATVVADLRDAPHIQDDTYDTIILTQTLHVIDDMAAVLRECRRILKPGGVLLATLPAASRVCLEYGPGGDLWRVTPAGAQVLMEAAFGPGQVDVTPYGNVQTNVAFLHGLATAELTTEEFDKYDPYYPALSGARARKPAAVRKRGSIERRGAVLLYHRIDDTADVHELNVTPEHFAEQLRWLRANCTVMPLDELLRTPEETLPERAVALTFDDGYVDNLEQAVPRLEEAGLPATFFLTTRWLDERGEYWWDALERALLLTPDVPARLEVALNGAVEPLATGSTAERRAAHDKLHGVLVESTLQSRTSLIDEILDWAGIRSHVSGRRPMTADEVLALSRSAGVTIGAHTVNHLALTAQTDAVAIEEVEASRRRLWRITGQPVTMCAYPYGAVDTRVSGLLRERVAWGIACGEAATGVSFDAARVPRVEVKDWNGDRLRSRLEEVFDDAPRSTRRGLR